MKAATILHTIPPKLPLVTNTFWSYLVGSMKLSWFLGIKCHGNIYEHAHQDPSLHFSEKLVSNCKIIMLRFFNLEADWRL